MPRAAKSQYGIGFCGDLILECGGQSRYIGTATRFELFEALSSTIINPKRCRAALASALQKSGSAWLQPLFGI